MDGGDFDQDEPQIEHIIQLIRLGSKSVEQSYDLNEGSKTEEKGGFIYVYPPSREEVSMRSGDVGESIPTATLDGLQGHKRTARGVFRAGLTHIVKLIV